MSATIYHQDTALRAQVEHWRGVCRVALAFIVSVAWVTVALAGQVIVRERQIAEARRDAAEARLVAEFSAWHCREFGSPPITVVMP